MTHHELQAMRAHVKTLLKMTGQPELMQGEAKSTLRYVGIKSSAPNLLGLEEGASDRLYKHLRNLRAEINAHRVEARKLPVKPAKRRELATKARVDRTFTAYRPSARVAVTCSPHRRDWRVYSSGKSAEVTVSPAWGFSTYPLHQALSLPFFILHSCRVGGALSDGTQVHRVRTARYDGGTLREDRDAPPYLAVNLGVGCYGRGETLLKARTALHAMMAKQVRTRLRG